MLKWTAFVFSGWGDLPVQEEEVWMTRRRLESCCSLGEPGFLSPVCSFPCVWPVTSGILLFYRNGLKGWRELSVQPVSESADEASIKYLPFLLSHMTFLLKCALTHPIPTSCQNLILS